MTHRDYESSIIIVQYYYEHFPAEHFSGLYLCNTILCGFGNFVCDPIFSNFILDGDNIADAHFDTGNYNNYNQLI